MSKMSRLNEEFWRGWHIGYQAAKDDNAAEPIKHGHWKPLGKYDRECSCCYGIVDVTNFRYCPNCGARMDEVERWNGFL